MQDRVCSTLFSVQIGHILTFFSKSQSPIPNDRIRNICRVLYMLDDNMLIHGTKKKKTQKHKLGEYGSSKTYR